MISTWLVFGVTIAKTTNEISSDGNKNVEYKRASLRVSSDFLNNCG